MRRRGVLELGMCINREREEVHTLVSPVQLNES